MSFFDVEAVWIRSVCSFFFNDTATTEIYTLSLHDALPISATGGRGCRAAGCPATPGGAGAVRPAPLQSHRRGGRRSGAGSAREPWAAWRPPRPGHLQTRRADRRPWRTRARRAGDSSPAAAGEGGG